MLPGIYKKVKNKNSSDLYLDIFNIYIDITKNIPSINTLLICDKYTSIEKIYSFLYRAIFCDKSILFLITNIELMELSLKQKMIKKLKKLKSCNNKINSYLLFIYEKDESYLSKELEILIEEKNIINNNFNFERKRVFNKIELYSSKKSGYGKSNEIFYKIKEKEGWYYYLPIGGKINKNNILNNLKNFHLDKKNSNKYYLHIDLYESENDCLMNEILFKLIILRYIDSNEKIYYLGNDVHLFIEIQNTSFNFKNKYKILNIINENYIFKLYPIRLRDYSRIIRDSPIQIVTEILSLYDSNNINKKNIDLDLPIRKNPYQCEEIINKYFDIKEYNYYQKMNFIKLLSAQFIKFIENPHLDYEMALSDSRDRAIIKVRPLIIKNYISLIQSFTTNSDGNIL